MTENTWPKFGMLPPSTLAEAMHDACEDIAWQVAGEGAEPVGFIIAVQTTAGVWHTAQAENMA